MEIAAKLPSPLPAALTEHARLPLGSLLVRDGLITAEQLELALAEKEETGHRLGRSSLHTAGWSRRRWRSCSPSSTGSSTSTFPHTAIEPAAAGLLPEKLARRYEAMPVRFLSEKLVLVAVSDPTNVVASDDLRLALGLNVRIAVAAAPDVLDAIAASTARTTARWSSRTTNWSSAPRTSEVARPSAPAISLVNSLIAQAIDEGASDLHFEPQAKEMVVRDPRRRRRAEPCDRCEGDAARRDEPPEDHGRARHRGAPRAAGRPHVRPRRRQPDGSPLRGASDHARRAGRAPDHEPHRRRRPPRARGARHGAGRGGGVRTRDPPAVRRGACGRADRLRQDHDALRRARSPQRRGSRADDDRGSGRAPDRGDQPDRGQLQERPDVRARPAHDPPLRSGRSARRRDPRRGDRAHRNSGRDDGTPRAHDAAHAQRGVVDRAPLRHGRRAEPARDVDQLHRRAAACAPALPRVPAGVRPRRRRARRGDDRPG